MCPIPAEEKRIQELLNEIEAAQERGDHGQAEELNYELDELCNMMEEL